MGDPTLWIVMGGFAAAISYYKNKSIPLMIIHGALSFFYLIYVLFEAGMENAKMEGRIKAAIITAQAREERVKKKKRKQE